MEITRAEVTYFQPHVWAEPMLCFLTKFLVLLGESLKTSSDQESQGAK